MATVVVVTKLICPHCGRAATPSREDGEVKIYKAICSCGGEFIETLVEEMYQVKADPMILDNDEIPWPVTLPEKVYVDKKGTTYRVIVTPYHQFSIRRRAVDAIGWSSDPKFQQNYDEYDKAQAALDEKALNKGWRVI